MRERGSEEAIRPRREPHDKILRSRMKLNLRWWKTARRNYLGAEIMELNRLQEYKDGGETRDQRPTREELRVERKREEGRLLRFIVADFMEANLSPGPETLQEFLFHVLSVLFSHALGFIHPFSPLSIFFFLYYIPGVRTLPRA